MSKRTSGRSRGLVLHRAARAAHLIDALEPRVLLSTITWVNRGMASDRFGEVFGAQANLARGVIDAAIDRWERVITDFNYSDNSNTYELTVAMRASGTGHGAVGDDDATIGGKPSEGTIVFDRGDDEDDDGIGDGGRWFLDTTPMDDIEFNGTIDNAFSGRAPNTSPAFGMFDMLTVAMHEMGHAFGMYSNATMNGLATDTNLADSQGGGSTFWVFEGPSVDHLFTSYDSGGGGSDRDGTQHTARSTAEIDFGGQTWNGASDLMNATYSSSQRKTIGNVTAWVMQDAWDVIIALPQQFGTFYSILNQTTGELLVRAPDVSGGSDDVIEMGEFFATYAVVVNIGEDVPGTGPLAGPGDIAAFATFYDPADINSILVQTGNGHDTVVINTTELGVGVTIETGDGDDTVELGNGDLDTNLNGPVSFNGGAGNDALVLDDITDGGGSDTYTISTTTLTKPAGDPISWLLAESVTLNASPNADAITVTGTLPATALRVNGRNGNDTINVQSTSNLSPVTVTTGTGTDTVNVNTDDTGIALAIFPGTEHVTTLSIGIGGRAALAGALLPNSFVLTTTSLSIDNGGVLDLTNNSFILDHVVGNPYVFVRDLIVSGRAGGAWTGSGITSLGAFLANPKNTTLGILSSSEYFGIYGNGTDFVGQDIDATAILVKYTYYGDTDFSGTVNFDDYARIDAGFLNGRTGWLNGDFNGDGTINFDDYALIDGAFLTQSGPPLRSAPKPGVGRPGGGAGGSAIR